MKPRSIDAVSRKWMDDVANSRIRLENLMSRARAAGYAMGDIDEREFELGSADQRWSRSSDPLIVQRLKTLAATRSANTFSLVRSTAQAFRARNLPVPVGKANGEQRRWTLPIVSGLSTWWSRGAAA